MTMMSPHEPDERGKKRSQSGFNLIEVMVALGILAFGILAVASMQESSLLASSRAYNITDGTCVAMDQMENLVALAFTDARLNDTNGDYEVFPTQTQGRFTIDYAVEQNDGVLPNGCKLIQVRVRWNEAGGARKSTELICTKERI
jgi:prepilin-type N-terminal cleavage/methylation domain-containing protein